MNRKKLYQIFWAMMKMIKEHPSYIYAYNVAHDLIRPPELYYIDNDKRKKFIEPKYVKKQCIDFLKIADGKSDKYCINEMKVLQIEQ